MGEEFKGFDIAGISLELESAIKQLEASRGPNLFVRSGHQQTQLEAVAEGLGAALRASQLALLATMASLGECRQDIPYSPLRPIIDEDGNFKWCCNHEPEHCK